MKHCVYSILQNSYERRKTIYTHMHLHEYELIFLRDIQEAAIISCLYVEELSG